MKRNLTKISILAVLLLAFAWYTPFSSLIEENNGSQLELLPEGKGKNPEDKNRKWTAEEAQKHNQRYSKLREAQPIRRKKSGAAPSYAAGSLNGLWKSRGPNNMPGAFYYCEMDEGTDTVYTVSFGHYGGVQFIWKGTLMGDDWKLINPKHPSRYNDLIALPLTGGKRRILGGQQLGDIIYSDNSGQDWNYSSGLTGGILSTIVNRQDNHVVYTTNGTKVYKSTDKGVTFQEFQNFGGGANNATLYSPRWSSQPGSSDVYLVRDAKVYKLNASKTAFTQTGTIPTNGEISLAGDSRKLWIVLKKTVWYSSVNGGVTWNNVNTTGSYYGDVTNDMYAGHFVGVNPENPDILLGGHTIPLTSRNSGATTNDDAKSYWGYYQNSVGNDSKVRVNYHPDFQSNQFFYDKNGDLISLRSSDGGVFISYNEWEKTSFPNHEALDGVYYNISLFGKPSQEAYRGGFMYGYQSVDHLSVGSQDQGWQDTRSNTFGEDLLSWDQIGGGDGPSCITGDGKVGWKYNYQGTGDFQRFDLYSGNTFIGQNGSRSAEADFSFTGESYFTPSVGDWEDGNRIWILSQTLRRITYSGGTTTAKEEFFGSGNSYMQGIAQSRVNPDVVYAMRNGAVHKSTNRGTSWVQVAASSATGISGFYNNRGMGWSSPLDQNIVLFATESGTSVNTVYSEDGGLTWENVTGGGENLFPSAEVNGMAGSKDGKFVFASTNVGPYVFKVEEKKWYSLATDADVPLFWGQIVYCVDYGDKEVVHFSTWGQGIWDFEINGKVTEFDVAVKSIENGTVSSCTGMLSPVVNIKNQGATTLTDYTIKVYVNDVLTKTVNHTTSLIKEAAEDVTIQNIAVSGTGLDEIKIVIESPNGEIDEDLSNNEQSISVFGNDILLADISGVSVSDQSGADGIEKTLDDDENTIWHNNWEAGIGMPHELVYDLGENYYVSGVRFLNRQDNTNGILKDVDFELSADGVTWSSKTSVVFPTSPNWISESLSGDVGRFVKMTINSNIFGTGTASFAEIRFEGCQAGGLTAAISSPITGTDFSTGDNITIETDVSSDGTISKVEFYLDNVLVNTDNTSAYSFTVTSITEGQHKLKVIAYDDRNGSKESNEVVINVTTPIAYDISLSNLIRTDNIVCGENINLSFDVENRGEQTITSFEVEVYLDNQLVETTSQTVNLSTGSSTSIVVNGVTVQNFGTQDLKVIVINPNNQTDEVTNDNQQNISIAIGEGDLHEFFIADRSANSSLTWEIKDGSTTVMTDGSATERTSGTDKVHSFCLAEGCYDLVVIDAFSAGGCSVATWDPTKAYTSSGLEVSYNGNKYRTKWYANPGDEPGVNQVWELLGACAVTYDTDVYGLRKQGEAEYFSVEVQNYTSPTSKSFCHGSSTTVGFDMNVTSATNCETVTFNSTTTPVGTAYSWDFGSGATPATATGVGPHDVVYSTTGAKTIALTVDGQTETKTNAVAITDGQVTPTITIQASQSTICGNEQVDFTITSQSNEGTSPSYEWFVGSTSVGSGTAYSSTSLTDGDKVTAVLTSSETCVSGTATSNELTMNVSTSVTPTIAIQASQTTICGNEQVDFTITSQLNEGTSPSYEWFVGSTSVGSGTAYSSTSLTDGDKVTAVLTSSETCVSGTATSNEVTMNVSSSVTPTIVIQASQTTICGNEQVDFTIASQSNEGMSPSYEWFVGSTSAGTGTTYSSTSLVDDDKVTAVLTSSEACASGTAASNEVTMNVSTSVTPTIAIQASETTICGNGQVDFTIASQSNEGTSPSYEWFVGSTSVGTGTTYSSSSLVDDDKVKVILTSDASCVSTSTATSNELTMNVSTSATPTIAIQASQTTICGNNQVDFTITSQSNEGTNPSYEWFVGSTLVGTGTTYSSTSLTDGDKVKVVLTSDANCVSTSTATSNGLTMNVSTSVTPTITIQASQTTICGNEKVDFTIDSQSNEGTSPSYEWFVGSTSVGTGTTYSSTSLTDGDKVTVVLTSNANCLGTTSATSNEVKVSVASLTTPTIAIALKGQTFPVCQGSSTEYEAVTTNGGTAVVDWYIDGVKVFQNSTLTVNNTIDGAEIQAKITSDLACTTDDEVESNIIEAEVNVCNGVAELDESLYAFYPNPSSNVLHIKGVSIESIEVVSSLGEIIQTYQVDADEFDINTSNFANGIYYVRIHSNGGQLVKEFYKN